MLLLSGDIRTWKAGTYSQNGSGPKCEGCAIVGGSCAMRGSRFEIWSISISEGEFELLPDRESLKLLNLNSCDFRAKSQKSTAWEKKALSGSILVA